MASVDFAVLILAMALASYGCRTAGFVAMRYVVITPRIEAALRATPLAVMVGLVTVAALRGGPAEWLACLATMAMAALTGRDIPSGFIGVAAIALARWAGL